MIAIRISILAFAALTVPYLVVAAPNPTNGPPTHTNLEGRQLGALLKGGVTLVRYGGKNVGKLITRLELADAAKDAILAIFPDNDESGIEFDSSGLADAVGGVGKRQVQPEESESTDSATDPEDAAAADSADSDAQSNAATVDIPACSIDRDQIESAASDALSKTQDLMSLSNDQTFQSAVTAFNSTLQPIFDGVNLLDIGSIVGGEFEPTPEMGSQFVSFINDAQSALQSVSAPSDDASSQIQSIQQDLSNAADIATANCAAN